MNTHSFSPNCGKKSRKFVKLRQFAGFASRLQRKAGVAAGFW
jgi:hypothetical protein